MRKFVSVLSFVVILTGNIAVNAEGPSPSCGTYNEFEYVCGLGEICCANDKNTWGCCPSKYSCCSPDYCCAPGEVCCKGTCCSVPCGPDKKCPSGAVASSVKRPVPARQKM